MEEDHSQAPDSTSATSPPNEYTLEIEYCKEFLETFTTPDGVPKYLSLISSITPSTVTEILIDVSDIEQYNELNPEKRINIQIAKENTRRAMELFSEAIDLIVPKEVHKDRADQRHYKRFLETLSNEEGVFPAELTRYFEVKIVCPSGQKAAKLRSLDALSIGGLVRVRGVVARASDVRPMAHIEAYLCTSCGNEVFQKVYSSSFTPLNICPSRICKGVTTAGRLVRQPRASRFLKYQEVRLQELSSEVPVGRIPKNISVVLLGETVRSVTPGELAEVDGVWLPVQLTGFRALKAGLTATTYLEAMQVRSVKKDFSRMDLSVAELKEVKRIAAQKDAYELISRSICPEVFGLEDVKKAILLMLVSGETKSLEDGMKIRGNINVLLVGDPGLAKSQLLKYTSSLSPRGVYTSGKGSSGVGLTAAVVRDSGTNEPMLEGGALVLADCGVCCIDEFDKMDEGDRTGIHEAMEQQSISIAKAGITARLNARNSVLAAANPIYSRYNLDKRIEQNIDIEAALLSRFDLVFVMVDQREPEKDYLLALHACEGHMVEKKAGRKKQKKIEYISADVLKRYIAYARSFNPTIPAELHQFIVKSYVSMRQDSDLMRRANFTATPRILVSLLRLSQSLARCRFSEAVEKDDVEEAIRLMAVSQQVIEGNKPSETKVNRMAMIKGDILEIFKNSEKQVFDVEDLKERLGQIGYTERDVIDSLKKFEEDHTWQWNKESGKVALI